MPKKKEPIPAFLMEQLLANKWKKQTGPVIYASKVLGKNKEKAGLSLILYNHNDTPTFALSLPDGAMINIDPGSIEELNAFERMIVSYEPNF